MNVSKQSLQLAAFALLAILSPLPAWADAPEAPSTSTSTSSFAIDPDLLGEAAASGFVRPVHAQPPAPCFSREIVASPSRPYWDSGAATTPCGNIETDFGLLLQPMGAGVQQKLLVSSVRFGLTQRLDLRWGATNHIAKSGGGLEPMQGIGDASISATYRFLEQRHWLPAMALSYGINLPVANPQKGFGSGFADHQFLFIASRDLRSLHIDFNAVGTLEGGPDGHEGATQFGLALTHPVTSKLSWIIESYGGPQPGTAERFGAALTGGSYMLRPWLVLDGAYTRTYTAGSPRQQILFGVTCARRLWSVPLPKGSKIGRLLGR